MENTWNILQKELLFHNIELLDDNTCQFTDDNKHKQTLPVPELINKFKTYIEQEKKVFNSLWRNIVDLLYQNPQTDQLKAVDNKLVKLFIFSLKDLAKFIDVFEELDKSYLKKIINNQLNKDINEFSASQIKLTPDYKISIDWVFRDIDKYLYLIRLLRFAMAGKTYVDSFVIKTAQATTGGPWGNLNIPVNTKNPGEGQSERIWRWEEEGENLMGRDKDLQQQERYTLGMESYNGDGRVSPGFYWREMRNEPFSWYDKETEEPYYTRKLVSGK